jgi:stage II sporulation protein AA (anti-sigma F factor antagonist)
VKVFEVDVSADGGRAQIKISGEIDLSAIEQLHERVEPTLERDYDVLVVDLRRVEFIDSSGVRFLLALNERAQRDGRRFALVVAGEPVSRVLELAGVQDRLEVVADPGDLDR